MWIACDNTVWRKAQYTLCFLLYKYWMGFLNWISIKNGEMFVRTGACFFSFSTSFSWAWQLSKHDRKPSKRYSKDIYWRRRANGKEHRADKDRQWNKEKLEVVRSSVTEEPKKANSITCASNCAHSFVNKRARIRAQQTAIPKIFCKILYILWITADIHIWWNCRHSYLVEEKKLEMFRIFVWYFFINITIVNMITTRKTIITRIERFAKIVRGNFNQWCPLI